MSPRRILAPALVASLVLFGARSASAHDPFEITTDARVSADRLDIAIAMARNTAAKACPEATGGRKRIGADEVDALRPAFEACARGLYAITAGGEALAPTESHAFGTEEGDVEIKLVYPRPAKTPLRFEAVFLARLPNPTYGALLTVTGDRVFLGQTLLRATEPAFATEIAVAQATAAPTSFAHFLRVGVTIFVAGLVVLYGLVRSIRALPARARRDRATPRSHGT